MTPGQINGMRRRLHEIKQESGTLDSSERPYEWKWARTLALILDDILKDKEGEYK